MEEVKNLDEELDKIEGVDSIDPSTLPDYPIVYDPPEGWPPLRACDGDSWYEKATLFERASGRRVLPLEYVYDENGNIIPRSKSNRHDTLEEINKANYHIYHNGEDYHDEEEES